jgi:hypothetical protein
VLGTDTDSLFHLAAVVSGAAEADFNLGMRVNLDATRALLEVSRPAISEKLLKQGLRVLYMVPWPSQAFFAKKPINSVADLKGSKMRTYNAQTARLAQLMGAVPTTVQATAIPQAFSSGIIDTMFTSAPTAVTTKAWDYTKFVYDTQAWVPKNVVFVNERAFQALPEAVRRAVLEQAAIAERRGWEWSQRDNDESPKVLAKNGMTLTAISPAFSAELKKIGDQMLDDWLKKAGPDGKRIIDAYRDKRHQSQPREPSAGCMFKNPPGDSAGRLIDAAGLKGERVGGAEVSTVHANFIINRGGATAADVITLVRRVRERVQGASGVTLEPEVLLYGGDWRKEL